MDHWALTLLHEIGTSKDTEVEVNAGGKAELVLMPSNADGRVAVGRCGATLTDATSTNASNATWVNEETRQIKDPGEVCPGGNTGICTCNMGHWAG